MPSSPLTPRLSALLALFYPRAAEAGRFDEVDPADMPAVYRKLLAHEHHMTVTVEAHHGSPVDVQVLRKAVTSTHYARMILLKRQSDDRVVQYGIMRINLGRLDDAVRRDVESERIPLGRILIQHEVMRQVHLFSLWKVTPGPDLWRHFGLTEPQVMYGRTAIIDVDGEPAIELLEIVAPEE